MNFMSCGTYSWYLYLDGVYVDGVYMDGVYMDVMYVGVMDVDVMDVDVIVIVGVKMKIKVTMVAKVVVGLPWLKFVSQSALSSL